MIREQLVFNFTAVTILLIVAEAIYSNVKELAFYKTKDTLTNLYLTTITIILNLGIKGFSFIVLDYFYDNFRLFTIQNAVLYWVVLVVFEDFLYWLLHLVDHYSRLFWAIHVTHHSSEEFNLTVGFRSSVFQPLYRFLYFIPLAICGFTALDIFFIYTITQVWGIIVHTKTIKKLHPIIEYIFVTPSHHRVHHASNVKYLDKNMGMLLIIWDRIFGTFEEEAEEEPVKYGLTTQPEKMDAVNVVLHEWKALKSDLKKSTSFSDKIKYILYPPGWSHDGSTKSASEMRKELLNKSE